MDEDFWLDSTEWSYQPMSGRRWPVRHNSGIGYERTYRGKWWKPFHRNRKQYPYRVDKYNVPGRMFSCWRCYRRQSHPWWRCDDQTSVCLIEGGQNATHGIKAEANRKYRHHAKQAVYMGKWDDIAPVTVDWLS